MCDVVGKRRGEAGDLDSLVGMAIDRIWVGSSWTQTHLIFFAPRFKSIPYPSGNVGPDLGHVDLIGLRILTVFYINDYFFHITA